ncbi:hypothetical protein Fmac_001382 [Flemingia macrophylla]|uniref:Uncharacterized protein n=1 Tax=Flemingia macrophylla TaxID=520843 RepID=A0ABD1NGX6_9FABA
MNIGMKRGLESLIKMPLERGCRYRLRCFNSASSGFKGTAPTLLQPRVLLYDAVSHLCHRGVKWVIRADNDGMIKFCCIQSEVANLYLRACGLEREDVFSRILFVEGLNVYSQGSTAALQVLSYLPLPYSALSLLQVIPTPLRDGFYDCLARRRYEWFGKAEDCLVLQEKELLERFVDREELLSRGQDLEF